jgi:hypothetical protein
MSGQFTFKGRVLNDDQIKEIMEISPVVYTRYMLAYLRFAGRTFIGTKKKNGVLREILSGLQSVRGSTWQSRFVNAAANFRVDKNRLEMKAGIIYTEKKKIHEIMEQMESGFTRTSSGYMIVPNYKALKRYPETSNKKPIGIFNDLIRKDELTMIFKGGNIYYIHKNTNEIMFVGTKKITIKKQWDFNSAYEVVRSKIEKRASNVIDRATKAATKKELADSISID